MEPIVLALQFWLLFTFARPPGLPDVGNDICTAGSYSCKKVTESLNGDCVWAAVARNMAKLNKIWRPLWFEIWQQKCRVEGCMAYGASEWAAMAYLQKEGKWYQDNASCHTCFIVYSHITHNLHCIHKTYIHTSYISQCLYVTQAHS